MDRFRHAVIVGALAYSAAPAAEAASILEEWYAGIGVMQWEYEERELPRAEATGGRLTGGVLFTPYLGLEAHFAMGGETTVDQVDVELDNVDSLLARLNAPVASWMHLYGLVGFSQTQVVVNGEGVDPSTENASGLSVGAGVEFRMPGGVSLAVDGIRYQDEPGFLHQAATATLKWRF